jgi:hypothetical protein
MSKRERTADNQSYDVSEDAPPNHPADAGVLRTSVFRVEKSADESPGRYKRLITTVVAAAVLVVSLGVMGWRTFFSSPDVPSGSIAPASPGAAAQARHAQPGPSAPLASGSPSDQARKLGSDAISLALRLVATRNVSENAQSTAEACKAAMQVKDTNLYQSLASQMPPLLTNDLDLGHSSAWLDFAWAQAAAGDVVGAQCTLSRGLEIVSQEYHPPSGLQNTSPADIQEYSQRQLQCAIAILEKQTEFGGAEDASQTLEFVRKAAKSSGRAGAGALAYCLMLMDRPQEVAQSEGERTSAASPQLAAWVGKLVDKGQVARAIQLGQLLGGQDDSWKNEAVGGCLRRGDLDKAMELAFSMKDQARVVDVLQEMVSRGQGVRAAQADWRSLPASESLRAQAVLLPYLPKDDADRIQIDKLPLEEPGTLVVLAAWARHYKQTKDAAGYQKTIESASRMFVAVRATWTPQNRLAPEQIKWQKAYIQFAQTVLSLDDQPQAVALMDKLAPAVSPGVAGEAARLYARLGRADRAMNLPVSDRNVIFRGVVEGNLDRLAFANAWKSALQNRLTDMCDRLVEAEVATGAVKQAYDRATTVPNDTIRRRLCLTFAKATGDFLSKTAQSTTQSTTHSATQTAGR